MALQTAFQPNIGVGFPGQRYDLTDSEALTGIVTVTALAFGVAAVKAATDHTCRLPDAGDVFGVGATTEADNPFLGLVMYQAPNPATSIGVLQRPIGNGDTGFLALTEPASLATEGRHWVVAATAVVKGQPVYYRATLTDAAADPQTESLGELTNTADGGNCVEIPGAQWFTSSDADGMAVVQL